MPEANSTNSMFQNAFIKNADGDYSLKTQTVQAGIIPAINATSFTDTTTINAPGAGVTIATVTPPAGTYKVGVRTLITGTTVAALEQTNMRLALGATPIGRVLNPVPGVSGATVLGELDCQVVTPGGAAIQVIAVAASTAGSIYVASISATRIM